jgi:hypothetical protein
MVELNQELARAAYDKHLPAALALPADRVLPYRVEPDLAINNISRAMAVVEAFRAEIVKHLPKISVAELDGLPSLALAVKAAALAVQNEAPAVSVTEMIAEGWELRATLMPVVAGLAATGVIPRSVYEAIASGSGTRDMAEDCVALSHVFVDHAPQVAGKHAAAAEVITRAETVGSWLLQNLRKKNAPPQSATTAAIDIRDRMATLLVERYSNLRAVAYYFHRDAFAQHAPALMSRHRVRQRDSEAPPAPEPAPEPLDAA